MEVEHDTISLFNMWELWRSLVLELWRDLLWPVPVAGELDFSDNKTVHSRLPSNLVVRYVLQDN